ncbi:1-aminocyclopropane-1-carboxylate deaminase [Reichenbachiella agariperforans]|uniref:1-aminocyclopropane-1-carboxylate deaminase n=1 Tax=Reichenbachiella agariperforans TaxID=156994 RepID=A0A1M6QJ01_REIAG|nr:pyridoxal-phosphate dependent enzyme [Reichenbachiella agariperforans]SHK20212.1 1-aminocyclopropane-1-carboxylate deaminase [Reichenbachiella agariperforans]
MFEKSAPTPLVPIHDELLEEKNIKLFLKREDLIDPDISGNKWRKLKYNLIKAKEQDKEIILTFGGAYSNHIAATAAAAKRFGFQAIGVIRGEELNENSNPTLQKAHENGMQLLFVSRADYMFRTSPHWLTMHQQEYSAFIIPEGGSNHLALQGVKEILSEIDTPFDYITCPVGTGGTLAGLASGLQAHQKALGFASLAGEDYLEKLVGQLLAPEFHERQAIVHDYDFGGYAKHTPKLIEFIQNFYDQHGIPLDPIYTGKMMYGLFDQIKKGKIEEGKTIVAVHTGGLQGIAGFNEQYGLNLKTI